MKNREIPDERIYTIDDYIASLLSHQNIWNSYYHQIKEIISAKPDSVLEIGMGLGITKMVVERFYKCIYHTFDYNEKLHPDFVGSVTGLPFEDDCYDIVCCFEVLEHLPFDEAMRGLSELCRVAKDRVILSLPNNPATLKVEITRKCKLCSLNLPFWKHKITKEHYWEINIPGFCEKKIIQTISSIASLNDFKLEKQYRDTDNPFHHYFILKRLSK